MLKGKKVILRSLRREDLQRQNDYNNDLDTEILGGGDPPEPQSLERLQAEFDKDLSRGARDGARFAIEADGLYIGGCGLFRIDERAGTAELGIAIGDSRYQGRGYGRDALRTLLEYAFRHRNFHKVWLMVNDDNERAIRSYRSVGFVEEGRLRRHAWSNGRYIDILAMGVLSDEWDSRQNEEVGE